MWSAYVILIWVSALLFTVFTLIYPRKFFIGVICSMFWTAAAYSMVQVHFLFAGSTNPILYDHELGDWYGETTLMYMVGAIAVIMMINTVNNLLIAAKDDVQDHYSGDIQPLENLRRNR